MSLEWIASNGGPLLLLEEHLLRDWRGADTEPSGWSGKSASDYQRACAAGEIGVLSVGEGQGLVIGGEVLETAWWPELSDGGGTLVRWVYADDDYDVERAIRAVPAEIFRRVDTLFAITSEEARLFDSAMPGEDILTPSIRLTLPMGRYAVQSARLAPDDKTQLLLHRLRTEVTPLGRV